MAHEFKMEKEAVVNKSRKDEEQAKIDFKAEAAKHEMEKNNQREKACNKRLELEKKLEEDTDKFNKERSEL